MIGFVLREWNRAFKDKWLFSLLFWMPLIACLIVYAIFSSSIARDLPVGVVDFSQSELSNQLVRYVDATDSLKVDHQFRDVSSAKSAMQKGDIVGFVVVPLNFERDIRLAHTPQVSVFYNSQYLLAGKSVHSALLRSVGTFNASIATVKGLSSGNDTALSAMGKAVPIQTQISPLFNSNSNYAQFIVSAAVPAIWQIAIVMGTVMVLAMHQRMGEVKYWFSKQNVTRLLGTLACYIPIFLLFGISFLIAFYVLLDWPMQGNVFALVIAQFITILACMAIGLILFVLTLSPSRALSIGGAMTAPSFAFMGVTFPVSNMPLLAQWWREILPVSHYIEAHVSQVSYAADGLYTVSLVAPMLIYIVIAGLVLLMARRHFSVQVTS